MWRKKQSSKKKAAPKLVGTEAAAKNSLERNRKDFSYPETGFVTPVEYTLLYSMLDAPTIYPENVLKDAIREEDFHQYLLVNPLRSDETEERHSYAQLSALLTLAAQKFPPPSAEFGEAVPKDTIPQILICALLQVVIRHTEAYNLDRETEVKELLEPLTRLTVKKDAQQTVAFILPAYLGLGASIVTGNPLPMYLGWAIGGALTANDSSALQNSASNLRQLRNTTNRSADAEKAGLLEDSEHND
jgi:hypothetical protein